jgi:hypothetical protein
MSSGLIRTDPTPTELEALRIYEKSDQLKGIRLPSARVLRAPAIALEEALASGAVATTRKACTAIAATLADFYDVPAPVITVRGIRPFLTSDDVSIYELFGDYSPSRRRIRVWMRTAVLGKVTSFKRMLNTLLHEFCHHLDETKLGLASSPHTRGFFSRIDLLYHRALATPPDKRRELCWVRSGQGWRLDWSQSRTPRRDSSGKI